MVSLSEAIDGLERYSGTLISHGNRMLGHVTPLTLGAQRMAQVGWAVPRSFGPAKGLVAVRTALAGAEEIGQEVETSPAAADCRLSRPSSLHC